MLNFSYLFDLYQTGADIFQAIGKLNKNNIKPTDQYRTSVIHLLWYLQRTCLKYIKFDNRNLILYCHIDNQ